LLHKFDEMHRVCVRHITSPPQQKQLAGHGKLTLWISISLDFTSQLKALNAPLGTFSRRVAHGYNLEFRVRAQEVWDMGAGGPLARCEADYGDSDRCHIERTADDVSALAGDGGLYTKWSGDDIFASLPADVTRSKLKLK